MSIDIHRNHVMKSRRTLLVFFIEYLWAFTVVLEGNSVYRHTVERNYHLTLICMVLSVMLFAIKSMMHINRRYLKISLFMFAYMAVYYVIRSSRLSSEIFVSTMLLGLPVMIMLFSLYIDTNEPYRLFECISNVVMIITVLSTIAWLFGTVFGLISYNTSVRVIWGYDKIIRGYYGLQYDVAKDTTFGVTFYRNQGLFTEAPMLSLWVSIALANELFLRKQPSIFRVVMFFAGIVSSVSTTGFIFIVLSLLLYYFDQISAGSTVKKVLLVFLMIFLIPIAYYAFQTIFLHKLSTVSYAMRFQDYLNGLMVFRENPLLGSGFGNLSTIITTTSIGAKGYSNSIMALLATGGIWFTSIFLIGLIGYFRPRFIGEYKHTIKFGICYLYLYITTIFFARFIAVVFFAFGLAMLTATDKDLSESIGQ